MGENGAGKSTLLKIINGDYQPDVVALTMDGRKLRFSNPADAHKAGIRVIYQEPEIVPGVDVAENIWVGELPEAIGFVDRRRLNEQVQDKAWRNMDFEDVLPTTYWAISFLLPNGNWWKLCGPSNRACACWLWTSQLLLSPMMKSIGFLPLSAACGMRALLLFMFPIASKRSCGYAIAWQFCGMAT